ncbi:hypothetical protein ACFPMF_26455 [Larkinella bovis]|uniref:Secretion system C-terminal sorting domain-containing protein n=1 Tax=Larkinella bovis TaxID=683041 RepID=A0ABW0IJ16_9BACT
MKTLFNSLFVALTLTFATVSVSQAETNKPVARPKKAAAFQTSMYTTMEGKLQIAVNKEAGGHVVVQVTNSEGKAMWVEPIAKNQQAARLRLDMSNLPDGDYQVVVSNGSEVKSKTVTLARQKNATAVRMIAIQ